MPLCSPARQVLYKDGSPSQAGETRSVQSDQESLRRELILRMDSHTSQVREMIDQHLDCKLTAFQEQIATIIRQVQMLAEGIDRPRADSLPEEIESTDRSSSSAEKEEEG